jgi:hypothetical protein
MSDRLESLLAARFAGLEASAGESDWAEVRRKARGLAARRLALRIGTAAMIALLTVLAATPALGGVRERIVKLFASGDPAPTRVVEDFAELDVGAPSGMAPGVIAGEAREVMEVRLSTGKTAILRVAPTRSGGFCRALSATGGGGAGGGGCDRDRSIPFSPGLMIPGPISRDGRILKPPVVIVGHTLVPEAAKVEIRYQDGEVSDSPVVWVSPPIDAGFFIYEVPERNWGVGHRPSTLILQDADGHELGRAKSYLEQALQRMSDAGSGAPRG